MDGGAVRPERLTLARHAAHAGEIRRLDLMRVIFTAGSVRPGACCRNAPLTEPFFRRLFVAGLCSVFRQLAL